MCRAIICHIRFCTSPSNRRFELAHEFECLVTLRDFLHGELAQTLQTECFHAKASQDASVNHRFTQIVEVHFLHCAREISGHAAGECVPCPGWIVNVFERIGAAAEELVSLAKEQCAMLAFFYSNILRPHLSDPTPGFDEACLFCYF